MRSVGKERRLHPRLDHTLPLKIAANGYDFVTNTQNVSCLGAYCHIDKYVPPFTKIGIKLNLPLASRSRKKSGIECNGVIVRTEDATDGGFNIAIFFNRINDNQRKVISNYISQFLP
ncbi:MAG: PilZ domain-containing protein [Candidatus Omnitrophica bacterium]|nr:PilZ domain-containing protein [Candidatus Omnitrophota bacterium]